jgi:acetoin utilization deacetylase AcuC-like enzyme
LSLAENICEGKLSFILEGGYSLVGLQHCVYAIVNALLGEDYKRPSFENLEFLEEAKLEDIQKIKNSLKKLLKEFWNSLDSEEI